MQEFSLIDLISNTSVDVSTNEIAGLDFTLLQAYIQAGEGPIPGHPEWNFTVHWQGSGGFFSIVRVDRPEVMLLLCGLVLLEEGADSMWEVMEDAHVSIYQSMATAWGHSIPDSCLGNPSQPTKLPWAASLLIPCWLTEYPGLAEWIPDFEKELIAAIIDLYS